MEHIREYLISVTAAALLCGMIQTITGEKSSSAGIVRLVCGIFLALTVIRPVAQIQLREFSLTTSEIMEQAQLAAGEGEDYAKRALSRHITEQTEAYILDKAKIYGAEISVEVTVETVDQPVPAAVTITGKYSPYARTQLSALIASELNIREEDQTWITSNSGY